MGPKTFKVSLAAIGALVLLSATPSIRPMIGFMCAIAAAFFIGPLAIGLHNALGIAGVQVDFVHLIYALVALYVLSVTFAFYWAFRLFRRGEEGRARIACAKAALFAALPLVAYVSAQGLMRAWPRG